MGKVTKVAVVFLLLQLQNSNNIICFSASALSLLHSNGFVHADLKPANVMWSSRDGCFKIIDFGLTFREDEEHLHKVELIRVIGLFDKF